MDVGKREIGARRITGSEELGGDHALDGPRGDLHRRARVLVKGVVQEHSAVVGDHVEMLR